MRKCKHCGDELPQKIKGLACATCKNGMNRYSMNKLQMVQMYESQNKKCTLCDKDVELFNGNKSNSGYIDHDHTTGAVRSILCHPCNTSIGYLEKADIDIDRLKQYLFP